MPICTRIGGVAGNLAYRLLPHYRRIVRRNLAICFSDTRTDNELDGLTATHFKRLGENLFASARTSLMSREQVDQLISYEGVENLQQAVDAGKGVVAALTHTANWELYSRIHPLEQPLPLGTIYQSLHNPFIDRLITKRRGAMGTQLFERGSGFRAPIEFVRNKGVLGILMDQHPGMRGALVPFFDRLTMTTTLPALVSLRTGAPIVFVGMQPNTEGKWTLKIHEPIFPPAQIDHSEKQDWTLSVTSQLNEKLVETITNYPEEWFWVHNRFKSTGREVLPQKLGLTMAIKDNQPIKPHYFLIRSPNPLGDACMSIPAVRAVKQSRPDAHITILCRSNLEPLWKQQAEVDDVISIPGKQRPRVVGELIQQHRSYFDTGILFPNSLSSGLEMKAGKLPFIYGLAGHHRKRMLRWAIPDPPSDTPIHHLDRYLHIVGHLGADISNREQLAALPPSPSVITTDMKQWRIGLCPGAQYGEAKRWPLEKYSDFIKQLRERHPTIQIEVSIIGSPAESELGEQLAATLDEPKQNLAGKTSIDELVEHLKTRHLVVSNDTGTMHLAAALGIPTVAIFGSTDPELSGPVGEGHAILREPVDCSPCFKRECPIDFRCMTRISAQQAADAATQIMTTPRS